MFEYQKKMDEMAAEHICRGIIRLDHEKGAETSANAIETILYAYHETLKEFEEFKLFKNKE